MSTLARVLINPQRRGARKLLSNPQAMHAAVRAAFPPDINETTTRVLWRADSEEHTHTLYILGPERPDLGHLVDQAGWSTRPGDMADFSPFLNSLRLGQEWVFRLNANPVKALSRGADVRGKVVPHVTAHQQADWLIEKSTVHGFEVLPDASGEPSVIVTRRQDLSFSKNDSAGRPGNRRRNVTLRTARFDGMLRITDVDLITSALTQGIGRGKAYGCGLLSLARRHS